MLTYIGDRVVSGDIASLSEAQEHSRITDTYDELVVQECLDAAHDLVERWLNRKLYPTDVIHQREYYVKEITIPFPPIANISAVTAELSGNEVELVEGKDWRWDYVTGSVRLSSYLSSYENFRVFYTCGYPTISDVPSAVKHGILMTFATLYENREDTVVGTQVNSVPLNAQRVIKSHRVRSFT